ncbi:hypothetical protein Tco_1033529 [Tanacetum coccineum]
MDDKDTNSEDSLKHPPGFTPLTHNCENDTSEKKVDQNDEFSEAGDVDKLKGSAIGLYKRVKDPKMEGVIANLFLMIQSDQMEREEGWNSLKLKILAKVINPVVLTQSPDSWSWTLNNSGGYTVASSRNMIDSRLLPKVYLKTREEVRYFPTK